MEDNQETVNQEQVKRPPTWIIVLSFAVLVGFLALIAWGLRRSMSGPIRIGDRVPEIEMTTFDGEKIHTSQFRGKVVVLNFWASWCAPCEQEAAELEEAHQLLKEEDIAVFLGLAWTDTEPKSLAYLEKFGITYPNGPDLRTAVSQMFRTRGVPETYIIAPDGRLNYVQVGPFESTEQILTVVREAAEE